MTAEEFEEWYAANSGVTVQQLREWGRIVAPCDCGEEVCQGWQSVEDTCCDDWWASLSAARKKWVHWYFRDIRVHPDLDFHYAIKDHREDIKE